MEMLPQLSPMDSLTIANRTAEDAPVRSTNPPRRTYRCDRNMEYTTSLHRKKSEVTDFGSKQIGREDRSLFIFSNNGLLRKSCKRIVENKMFEYFMLLTIAANCIVLMIATPLSSNDNYGLNEKIEQGDWVFVAIFTLEAVLKIITYGLFVNTDSYLRSGWNILDFIVVIVGIVQISTVGASETQSSKRNSESIRALRAVRVLRPLKLVSGIPSLQILMKSLFRAMIPLLQILLLVLFVIIIYSIVGLELLRGRFHFTCFKVTPEHPNGTHPLARTVCDHHLLDCGAGVTEGKIPLHLLQMDISFYHPKPHPCVTTGWGRKCPEGHICRRALPHEWTGPNYGITTFDNMFLAMLTVLQCITLEGWSEIMYLTMDSRDKQTPILTWCAFILLIVVGSFFMLNLVLGVLSGEFAKERERVENRKSYLKIRKQRQVNRTVEHYKEWIEKAEELLALEDEEEVIIEEEEEDVGGIVVQNNHNLTSPLSPQHPKLTAQKTVSRKRSRILVKKKKNIFRKYEKRLRIGVRTLTKSKVFYWTVLLLVLLNTISMACNHYQQSATLTVLLDTSEVVFTALFLFEILIRCYGAGLEFFHNAFNRFDFVVVWLSIADLAYKHVTQTNSVGISVLRSIRLLRIFKLTRFWSSMQNVISSLMNSIRSILSLILLLLLFIFIFALLGMQLFGGQFHTLHRGTSRTNFNTFPKAMLAVFQIISGEDWNAVMYQGITAFNGPKSVTGILISLYFVILVIIGNYTLLNVFLAIAVDNLANAQVLAKDEEEEKKRLEEAKKARTALYAHPEQKVSKWGKVRQVPKILAFTKNQKDKDESNPFKGYHYRRRPPPIIRAVSESDLPPHPCEWLTLNYGRFSSLDTPVERVPTPTTTVKVRRKPFLPYQHSFDEEGSSQDALHHSRRNSNIEPTSTTSTPHLKIPPQLAKIQQPSFQTTLSIDSQSTQGTADYHMSSLSVPDSTFRGSWKVLKRRNLQSKKVLNTRSLLLFSPSSRVRTACHSLVTWRHFDNIMLFFILASSLILAIEDPLDDNREKNNQILLYADIGVVAIFTFEIVVKLVDQGAFAHKGSYLRDWWNVFDTFVVACNIAATALALNGNGKITDMIGESTVKAMRIMRVFRPLRVVNKITGLKLVFQCVVFSLKRVLNIIIITMLCLFMFAVIGNHLFQGKFHYCTDVSKLTEHECQGEFYYYHNPIVQPDNYTIMTRVWKNYDFNFDNVPIAMLTLFTCGTGEGWPIIMEKSIDATDVDRGPIPDNNMYLCLYYVFFVVVYSFFFLNIFVALIIVTFQEQGEKEMIGSELNKNQRACLHFVLTAKPRQRFMPADKQGFAFKIWRVVDSKPFEIVIMSMIASNAVVLMLSYDSQSAEYERVLEKVNLTFTFLFTIEALLKLIAYQLNYFRDGWNVFDFCIVFVTVVGAFINMFPANPQDLPIDPSFFRLFRAFRLLKLLRQGYNIRILLWTFLQSLKALPYVVLLIVMLFFIYAVIGMQLFSKIRFDNRRQINEYNNFRGFLRSLGVLFRCGTGEAWHLVMLDCFDNAVCYNDPGSYCGSTVASITYFCSFYFFYAFLLLNLFVAVIMDNFDYLTRDESILGPHHMDEFVRVWSDYDPSAAGRIAHEDIYQLMCDMQPPVGFGKKCPRFLAYKRLMKLNMPISGDNTVLFTPTIFALVRTSLRMTQHDHECFKDSSFRKIIKRIWPNTVQKTLDIMMPEQTVLSDQQITIGKIYAAKLIYESFKDIKKRKTCTLPQFEMFEATHKRGNSFFHKVMGALRTSSQPLVPPERPREQPGDVPYYRRRRSQTNSASSKNEFGERLSQPSPRVRSVSTAGFTHRPADFLTLANKINLSSQQSYPMLSSNTPTRGRSNKLYDEITFQCPRRQSPRRSRVTSPVESFTPDKIESFDQTNNDSENTRANCDMPTRNKCLKSSSFTHCDLTSRESNNSDNSVFTADNKHLTDVFVQSVVNVLVDSKCERLKAAAKKINDANLTSERTCSNVGSCSGTNSNLNGKNSGYIVDDSNICRTNKNNSSDNTNAEASSLCRTNSNLNNKNNKAGSPTSPEKHSPVSSSCRRPSTKQISTRHYTSPLLASSPENVASFEANSMAAEIEEGRRESRALTDSLITALRDPAKPILCFVNQQMPSSSGVEPHSGDTGMESRSNTSSTSHVTVTLPMIKLEIPVERSESSRGSNFTMQQNRHRPLCSTDFPVTCSNVPDLIQSTRKKPQQQQQQQNADQTNSQISEDQSESSSTKTSNSPSSEGPEVRPPAEEEGMSGEEILRDRVSRALARQTQWIYKLENKDTWC